MIGVAALTITRSIMSGFEQSLQQRVLSLSPQVQILSGEGSISNYAEIEQRAASIKGVNGTDPFTIGQGMLSSGRGIGGVLVRGIEPNNPVVQQKWGRYVTQGGFDRLVRDYTVKLPGDPSQDTSVGALAIGSDLADKLKVKVGDPVRMVAPIISTAEGSVSPRTGDFVVGAIFVSGMTYVDTTMVFMDLRHAQDFFGRSGRVDGIEVHLINLNDTQTVTAALRSQLARPFVVRNWIQYNESASAGFALLSRVYTLVLFLLIGVAAFNLVATLIMVVMEKRKDIAVLIAMGATPPEVRRIFVLKGLVVGAAGTVAGLSLGAAGCFALSRYHFIHIPKEI